METSPLTFSEPVWFFALAIVPVVAALYLWSQRRSDALLSKVVAPRLRSQLAGTVSKGRRTLKSAVILAVFGLIALALARPQMGFVEREVKQRGRDVIDAKRRDDNSLQWAEPLRERRRPAADAARLGVQIH